MAGVSVGERLESLRARVSDACARSGRDPGSVKILAVSKLQTRQKIREAFEHGQRDFAENYVQEALEKLDQLQSLPVDWHFIGRIQSNKVKHLVNRFTAIHSVDRISVAGELNRLSTRRRQDVFLQFNVAGESSKGGAAAGEISALARFIVEQCPALRVLGLMCMPPLHEDARPHFRRTREMLDALRAGLTPEQSQAHPLDQLSMGTSADFPDAVAEGATWIRVGTEVFGPREEKQ